VHLATARGGISPPQKSTPARRAKKFSGKSKIWLVVFILLYTWCFPFDGGNKTQIQSIYYSKFGVFGAGLLFGWVILDTSTGKECDLRPPRLLSDTQMFDEHTKYATPSGLPPCGQ
jgi:hypothetical protein